MTGNVQSWSLVVLSCLVLTVKSHSEPVKDVKCSIHSPERTHCSWRPASVASNISFYYDLVDDTGVTEDNDEDDDSYQECSSYTYTGGVRTGCDLKAHHIGIAVHIYINGSSESGFNCCKIPLWRNVMPPKLNLTLNKTKDRLYITWNDPDIGSLHKWTFEVRYNTCKIEEPRKVSERSFPLTLGSTCPHRVEVRGKYRDGGETPWSDVYEVEADAYEVIGPKALVYASVIIPMTLAVLAVLACVCCQRNKHIIFPKVPEPRDFLSEISNNNNNKSIADNFYNPEEEENCEIILVTDPQDKQTVLVAHAC
ncbi:uncharacterized protein V6R79_018666 [Siganus canaliculatus]